MAEALRLLDFSVPSSGGSPAQKPQQRQEVSRPKALAQALPFGRLIELSGSQAQTTTAVSLVIQAQAQEEPVCWIQPEGGGLYPPDLMEAGVDLESLVAIHIPSSTNGPSTNKRKFSGAGLGKQRQNNVLYRTGQAVGLVRAAELALRSGAFGLVIIDLTDGNPKGDAWSNRLAALSRQHGSKTVLMTSMKEERSAGPMVTLRIAPKRDRRGPSRFVLAHQIIKNKSGTHLDVAQEAYRGPWGLG